MGIYMTWVIYTTSPTHKNKIKGEKIVTFFPGNSYLLEAIQSPSARDIIKLL